MAEAFYSRSWAAPEPVVTRSGAKRVAIYAVALSVFLHIVGVTLFPYLNEMEPRPPAVTLVAELLPPVEPEPARVAAPPPAPRVTPIQESPPVTQSRVVQPPPMEPPPTPIMETLVPTEPLPIAPVPVAQPDIAAEQPASNLAAPQAAASSVPPVAVAQPEVAPKESAPTLPIPVPLTDLTEMPRFRVKTQPVYPPQMQAQNKEATVKLDVLLDEKGKPRKVTVVQSGGAAFDEAAIAALEASEIEPGKIGKQAVAVIYRVSYSFRLQ